MEPQTRPPRASATLLLVATFALGMIAGAAILHIARLSLVGPPPRGPEGPPPPRHLEAELGLEPAQLEQLERILDTSRHRMRAEADSTRERIREILTPAQRERFDAMRRPPPPGPHPPPRGPMPPGPGGPRRPPPRG